MRRTAPVLRATFDTLPDGYHLLVGKDLDDLDEFAKKIKTALLGVISLIFVLAGLASVSVTRRTVGRIDAINATSRAIMQSGLGKRIPLRGTRDEWDQLAENLNSMLDRIEALMGEVKQVTDNVAHDLRTPLTRMRGRLEKAYNRQRNGDHDQSLIGDTMADLDAVLRMFSSLTRISQIEAERSHIRVPHRKPGRDRERGRGAVRCRGGGQARASQVLSWINECSSQVIETSCSTRWPISSTTPSNMVAKRGQVTVEVTPGDGGAVISVADDGPGIPAEECRHVFKRFYRLERSRRTPGNGLGLSLVAAVARLHGARIELVDNRPGLKCRLWFPLPVMS